MLEAKIFGARVDDRQTCASTIFNMTTVLDGESRIETSRNDCKAMYFEVVLVCASSRR
jgi:hypothetical protein